MKDSIDRLMNIQWRLIEQSPPHLRQALEIAISLYARSQAITFKVAEERVLRRFNREMIEEFDAQNELKEGGNDVPDV
jgi:hypothetical protein